MWIFLAAIAIVAILGIFEELAPNWGQIMENWQPQFDALGDPNMYSLSMVAGIEKFILVAGFALFILFSNCVCENCTK